MRKCASFSTSQYLSGNKPSGRLLDRCRTCALVRRTQAATTHSYSHTTSDMMVRQKTASAISHPQRCRAPMPKPCATGRQRAGDPIDPGRLLARLAHEDAGSGHQNIGSRLILTWPILKERSRPMRRATPLQINPLLLTVRFDRARVTHTLHHRLNESRSCSLD